MLVLSRQVGQSIVIDNTFVLTVTFVGSEAAELTATLEDGTFLKSAVLAANGASRLPTRSTSS